MIAWKNVCGKNHGEEVILIPGEQGQGKDKIKETPEHEN